MKGRGSAWFISVMMSVLIGSIVIGCSDVFAQRVVTLEEAYRLGMARGEQIAIARENVTQAEKEVVRARGFLYPTLSTDASYLRRPEALFSVFGVQRPESEKQFNVTLEQPLYTGGRASAAYQSAKLGLIGQRLDLSLTTEGLLFEIALSYYDALKARRNVEIERNEVERLTAHLRDADKRFRVGEATKTVVLRAEAELASARAQLIRSENALEIAKDRLALFAEIEGSFEIAEPPSPTLPEKSESGWVEVAYEHRTALKRQRTNIEIAEEGIDIARGTFYPSLSLEARYNWVDQNPTSPFLITNDRSALVRLTFPIFEGGRRVAELAQAKSRHRQELLQRQLISDEIAIEVRRARLNLTALTSQIDVLKAQVAFARENFALVSRQFAVGLATNIDVLDANATLLDAERQLSNTTYDREVAILELERSVGIFLDLIPPQVERADDGMSESTNNR